MNAFIGPQYIILIRALALYLADQIKEGDLDNAKDTVELISIASHYVIVK